MDGFVIEREAEKFSLYILQVLVRHPRTKLRIRPGQITDSYEIFVHERFDAPKFDKCIKTTTELVRMAQFNNGMTVFQLRT